MGLLALLRLLAGALILWLLWRAGKRLWLGARGSKPGGSQQPMKACATCGTYVPVDNSIQRDGRYYCSIEHIGQSSGAR